MQHLAGVAQHNSVLCKKCGDPFLAADAADSKGHVNEKVKLGHSHQLCARTLWSAAMVFRDEQLPVMDA